MQRKLSRRQVLEGMALGVIGLTAAGRVAAQARAKIRFVLPTPATTYQLPFWSRRTRAGMRITAWTSTRSSSAATRPRCAR